jgi:hypothetical protein
MHDHKAGPLTDMERTIFRRLVGIMIPSEPEMALPCADDPMILQDCLSSLGRDATAIRTIIAELLLSGFVDLSDEAAELAAMALLRESRVEVQTLSRVVVAAYYRDDRVMLAYGREPRPPFPRGHTLVQGDWGLLEVVKAKPPLWRDDRDA